MPRIVIHRSGQVHEGDVPARSNLVVKAGIRQFPHPHLRFGCGMGKCCKCASRVLAGGEHLPPPNWKEQQRLGHRLEQGYRLMCQLWIEHDLAIAQDDEPLQPLPPAAPPAASA